MGYLLLHIDEAHSLGFSFVVQAQKAEKDATELKGTMRKRMEFLDLD